MNTSPDYQFLSLCIWTKETNNKNDLNDYHAISDQHKVEIPKHSITTNNYPVISKAKRTEIITGI